MWSDTANKLKMAVKTKYMAGNSMVRGPAAGGANRPRARSVQSEVVSNLSISDVFITSHAEFSARLSNEGSFAYLSLAKQEGILLTYAEHKAHQNESSNPFPCNSCLARRQSPSPV
jgi:hypothetical protein